MFNWESAKVRAVKTAQRQAIRMATKDHNGKANPDFEVNHQDWVRDVNAKNYTVIKNQIKKQVEDKQIIKQNRRDRYVGKQ